MRKSFIPNGFCKVITTGMLMAVALESGATVGGIVISAEDQEAIPGVQITYMLPDSTIAGRTVSDQNGRFLIDSRGIKNASLRLTLTGYNGSTVTLGHDNDDEDVGEVWLTPVATRLDEVTVEGQRILTKSNKFIIYPDESELNTASTVTDVLANMSLPGLKVNAFENTVSIYNKNAVYKINGVERSWQDVMALNPSTIMRIDYVDHPVGRYMGNDAGGIIEITLKPATRGGSLFQQIREETTMLNGYNTTALTYINRRSEFRLNYGLNWIRNDNGIWGESTHYLNSERPATQYKSDNNTSAHNYVNNINASYTLGLNHDAVIDITGGVKWDNDITHHPDITTITATPGSPDEEYHESQRSHWVITDFGAGVSYTRNLSTPERLISAKIEYSGTVEHKKDFLSQPDAVFNTASRSTPSVITAELDWNFPIGKINMNAGISEKYLFSKVTHTGTAYERSSPRNNTLYPYVGIDGRIGNKWSYNAIGALKYYSFRENGAKSDEVFPAGYMSLTYMPSTVLRITLDGEYSQYLTALSERTDYFSVTDNLNAVRGNPNLKNLECAQISLSPVYYKNPWSLSGFVTLKRYWHPRMLDVTFEDPYYVTRQSCISNWDLIIGHLQAFYTLKPAKEMTMNFSGECSIIRSLAYMPNTTVGSTEYDVNAGYYFNYKSWSAFAKWESKYIYTQGYKRRERPSAIYLMGSWAYRNIVLGAYTTFKLKRDISEETFFRNPDIDRYTWNGIDGGQSRIALSFTYKISVGRKGNGRNPQSTLGADKGD